MPADEPISTAATSALAAGPLLHASLRVASAEPFVAAYGALGLVALSRGQLPPTIAQAWGLPALALQRMVELGPPGGQPLLRLIEEPGAQPRPTRLSHGWMALEVLVRDVDALAPLVHAAGFEVIGAPADLDVSPHIRAMQVIGPAGEMLYLTQVRQAVPPFELPLSSELPVHQHLGSLFIGVMNVPSREEVLRNCQPLAPKVVLRFDTRITVLNRALQLPMATRWPVATLQWAGGSLFEVDEVVNAAVTTPLRDEGPPQGLSWLTMCAEGHGPGLHRLAPGVWLETV